MKLQEIRIGSWIRGYYDEGSEDTVCGERKYRDFKVVNILGRLEEVESEEGEIFHIEDCDGIPLTEEVLKAYFTYNSAGRYEIGEHITGRKGQKDIGDNGYIIFRLDGVAECSIWNNSCNNSIDIKNVHQLQNALWDCGLYDLADNIKIEEQ